MANIRAKSAGRGRMALATLLLGLFLLVSMLAHFEPLHQALHPDAGALNHHCAVTLLQAGQVEIHTGADVIVRMIEHSVAYPSSAACFTSSADCFLPPSCGPPVLPS